MPQWLDIPYILDDFTYLNDCGNKISSYEKIIQEVLSISLGKYMFFRGK
jgi:hypothetical protein